MDRPAPAVIRAATEADLPGLEWGGEYAHFRRLFEKAMEQARKGRRVLLLAEIDDQIVGQIFVQFTTRAAYSARGVSSGYLYAFRVKATYRNQGVGTQLLQEAEANLRGRGIGRAVISVAQDNAAAQRLYQRYGYKPFASDAGQWSYIDHKGRLREVREPAYVLEKWL